MRLFTPELKIFYQDLLKFAAFLSNSRLFGKIIDASVAQWIEHLASDQGVAGSTPVRRAENFAKFLA